MFDGFLLTILILVSALGGVYYYAYSSLNYFDANPALKTIYERKRSLNSLAKRLKKIDRDAKLNALNKRNPASVETPSESENIFPENSKEAKLVSKKYFTIAKVKCYELNAELECLRIIEEAVTHYPESEWTGESLVLLTDFYYRTRRISQAREILKILKQDFRDYKPIQEKVIIIERHLF